MSVKSILKDMKGELGSISRRGFDVKFGYGLRSRSHRVVQDSFVMPVSVLKQSCWADLPPELLREILGRIEVSEDDWPDRKHVVACAGVCKSWRRIVKEIVKIPQDSGKITFPISLKQPGPRGPVIQCFIKRNRCDQTYYLYLSSSIASTDDGKFLLAARRCRRPTYTDYIISLACAGVSKRSSNYIGKLRSNFLATKFTVYDSQPPDPNASARMTKCRSTRLANLKQVSPRAPTGNYRIARIAFEMNALGSRGPRRMQCIMDAIPISAMEPEGQAPTQTEFLTSSQEAVQSLSMLRSKSSRVESSQSGPLSFETDEKLVLINKSPRWHEQLQCWCLNFNGRVTVASVKNFQLVASAENGDPGTEDENVILQFGKVGKDVFTMDYQYPLSAFQAFAICLSSFDTKIARE